MKKLKYLSPSSISTFLEDKSEFYLKYLAEDAPDRIPQTQPMSVGSAFDAYTKSYLHQRLVGDSDSRYTFESLFEAQVEPRNRDWALAAGLHAFNSYKISGALNDLLRCLNNGKVKFEFTIEGIVDQHRDGFMADLGGVKFLGKPDAYFSSEKIRIILDWKVNGFCAKNAKSPNPGYSKIRDGWTYLTAPSSRGANSVYKGATVINEHGWEVNVASFLENTDESWARQVSIYSWLCGEPIGGDFICAIDQLACKPHIIDKPLIRIAEHRMRVSREFQMSLYNQAKKIWDICNSGYIFRELTKEKSEEKQAALDNYAKTLRGDGTEQDKWLADAIRGGQ